jgi:ornithine cyclodeaminase/alanine dehydrogenase-like protein (mu-crystallin family)
VLAFLDGSVITDLRTGAVSGVIARRIALNERVTVGVIGAGHQARMQLESLATVYRIASAAVYSPTYEHCEAFACEMSRKLHLPIKVTESAEAAARDRTVVVAASSARTSDPILHGAWLGACRLLCAVGNTRPQFAEIDVECFSRAALIVADTEHAFQESGELKRAGDAGAVPADKRTILAQLVSGQVKVPRQGLVVFKSVGSALQDLALASRYYELLADSGIPAAADLASARRPVREIRAAVKPTSRKRGPRS